MKINRRELTITFLLPTKKNTVLFAWLEQKMLWVIFFLLSVISSISFTFYLANHLGLAYNDARSHLDIGRRVVEGLKPGFAQLGSVWLPLPHLLMVPTIWLDFMWHSGLAGALQSMLAFIATGILIYRFLQKIGVTLLGRLVGVSVFVANINVLYLQSTAMTELLLLATMTAGVYELVMWQKEQALIPLIKSAFWIMCATLIRYDGWFLLLYAVGVIFITTIRKYGWKVTEGKIILFGTLAAFGVFLWFLWNLLIFKDPLYFALGPFSAHSQQLQLESAGNLATKHNLLLSIKMYWYALAYNTNTFLLLVGIVGSIVLFSDKRITAGMRIAMSALYAPLLFNIIALYFGHSVLFIQGLSGNTWFNVRYGILMMPSLAIFIGYLVYKAKHIRISLLSLMLFITIFTFVSADAVTIDDARVGSSQKNVSEVSSWLLTHTKDKEGFILISAASHDAIIFSSGLPMKKYIHEGTGVYWEEATTAPEKWARWIVMRTNDTSDLTFKAVSKTPGFKKYHLVSSYPFADIYELNNEYVAALEPKLGLQQK